MTTNSKSLVVKMAEKFGVEPGKFFDTLKATAFKQRDGSAPTNEQMMALMIVADQYGLNPFTKEIYAFPDKNNGIVPVVGADGWVSIINSHSQLDGIEFVMSENIVTEQGAKPCPEWIDCIIYRKDRSKPIKVREYLDETYRPAFQGKNGYVSAGPWQTHTKRMLRHKALIQCARVGFGFTGIFDPDEAANIVGEKDITPFAKVVGDNPSPVIGMPQATKLQIEMLVDKLAARAVSDGLWTAAHEYAQSRFRGADLVYATQLLQEREMDAIPVPVTNALEEQREEFELVQATDANGELFEHEDESNYY